MIPEFMNPSFVNENDPDTIHERMMAALPADMDNTPGGFPWDFTRPTALEKSEMIQFHLVQTLMLMFPMWAWDEWLDMHAAMTESIRRRKAGYAAGTLVVKGTPGTIIREGTVFATPAMETSPSIEYKATEEYEIGAEGEIEIEIIAAEAGSNSNVAANTITLMAKSNKAISYINNPEPVTGGTEEEDDESLRQRIQEANEDVDISFVGNDSDYIRWGKEVIGVGSVTVIPEPDNVSGLVRLVVTDANGEPANDAIRTAIYNHIMSPDNRINRKAPIGATLEVLAPDIIDLNYEAGIRLYSGYELEYVQEQFRKNLLEYYEEAKQEGILKYTKICAVLSHTEGVYDFAYLEVNGGYRNIELGVQIYPRTNTIGFTEEE